MPSRPLAQADSAQGGASTHTKKMVGGAAYSNYGFCHTMIQFSVRRCIDNVARVVSSTTEDTWVTSPNLSGWTSRSGRRRQVVQGSRRWRLEFDRKYIYGKSMDYATS
jgi:hypothetical protein